MSLKKKSPSTSINRRKFLQDCAMGSVAVGLTPLLPLIKTRPPSSNPALAELEEVTIAELQNAMKSGRLSARSIAEKYLARIARLDKRGPAINSVIELNPDALSIAEALDRERKAKGTRGPLHGIPVL